MYGLHRAFRNRSLCKGICLSAALCRYRSQMTTCAFVALCIFLVFVDPFMCLVFLYMCVAVLLVIPTMDCCCTCCAFTYLRCTCKDDNTCRFKQVERLYMLTGVAYQPPSKYTPERGAVRGWMYTWCVCCRELSLGLSLWLFVGVLRHGVAVCWLALLQGVPVAVMGRGHPSAVVPATQHTPCLCRV